MPTRDLNHWRSRSTRVMRGDRRVADARSEERQIVKSPFGFGIENPIPAQRGQPFRLVDRHDWSPRGPRKITQQTDGQISIFLEESKSSVKHVCPVI